MVRSLGFLKKEGGGRGLTLLVLLAAGDFRRDEGLIEKRACSYDSKADGGLLELTAAVRSGDGKEARTFVAAASASGAMLAI